MRFLVVLGFTVGSESCQVISGWLRGFSERLWGFRVFLKGFGGSMSFWRFEWTIQGILMGAYMGVS